MAKWQPVGPPSPIRRAAKARKRSAGPHTSFISYPMIATEDAQWVADVLGRAGIARWMAEHELEASDSLPANISTAIRQADSFVPIVDQGYLDSQWCIRELEIAADAQVQVAPVQFSFGKLTVPPHLRDIYETALGDPLMLDLRRAGAEDRLVALGDKLIKASLKTKRASSPPKKSKARKLTREQSRTAKKAIQLLQEAGKAMTQDVLMEQFGSDHEAELPPLARQLKPLVTGARRVGTRRGRPARDLQ